MLEGGGVREGVIVCARGQGGQNWSKIARHTLWMAPRGPTSSPRDAEQGFQVAN